MKNETKNALEDDIAGIIKALNLEPRDELHQWAYKSLMQIATESRQPVSAIKQRIKEKLKTIVKVGV
jgi:hypothetical protein